MSVAFFTKTWEGDYHEFLKGAFNRKWQSVGYDFDVVGLCLNNGLPFDAWKPFLGQADYVISIDKKKDEILKEFNLTEDDFKGGINYSIAELASILYCDCDYLCYVQGDTVVTGDFVTPGIALLEEDESVSVVAPASEVNSWGERDHYMSDQAFLVRVKEFLNPAIYHYPGIDPDYPSYGGNSFEHMVGKYLKQTGKFRALIPHVYATHPAY